MAVQLQSLSLFISSIRDWERKGMAHVVWKCDFCHSDMSKTEAMSALRNGHRVTHKYFVTGDWIRWSDMRCALIDQDAIEMSWTEFWAYRNTEGFNDGWEIVE